MSSRSETSLADTKYVPESLKWMFVVAGVLITLGALNVYSATYYMNMESGVNPYTHLGKHIVFLVVSIIAGIVCAKCPKKLIRKGAWLWVLITLCLLLLVMVAGRTVNGATRWIYLAGVSLQPSEIAKVTGLIWASSYLAKQIDHHEKVSIIMSFIRPFFFFLSREKKNSFRTMLKHFIPIYGPLVMAAFVLKQPDMGTAVIILMFPLLLYILAGLPIWEFIAGMGVVSFGGAILILAEPYRWDRVKVLWDPFPFARDEGYQTVQSLIAVGSGGFFGQAGGEGMSKFLYLPEQYTDFAFAVFSQEFGFVGAMVLVLLYLAFLFTGFSVASKLKETYAMLLVYGLTLLITVQGLINIAMVIGCFPVTGVPLPFISFGGTSLLINIMALGLIFGTTVQSLKQSDMEERKRRIAAMEGRGASFSELNRAIYR